MKRQRFEFRESKAARICETDPREETATWREFKSYWSTDASIGERKLKLEKEYSKSNKQNNSIRKRYTELRTLNTSTSQRRKMIL